MILAIFFASSMKLFSYDFLNSRSRLHFHFITPPIASHTVFSPRLRHDRPLVSFIGHCWLSPLKRHCIDIAID